MESQPKMFWESFTRASSSFRGSRKASTALAHCWLLFKCLIFLEVLVLVSF